MKCKECKYFSEFQNTDECGLGMCTFESNWGQVKKDMDCPILPKPYTCKDCGHFTNDFACMTAEENDSADECVGFESVQEGDIYGILYNWELRGFDVWEKIEKIYKDMKENFKKPERRE